MTETWYEEQEQKDLETVSRIEEQRANRYLDEE